MSFSELAFAVGSIGDAVGLELDFEIIPFRGGIIYYCHITEVVNHLIYPADPALPFLGVHLTRMIDGTVTVGPNAVLALGREAYAKTDVNFKDLAQMFTFSGMFPMLKNNLSSGINELKNSVFKQGYLKLVQKYCPQIQLSDLLPYRSGIRVLGDKDGALIHDFNLWSKRSLHGNAFSAATSALPIADALFPQALYELQSAAMEVNCVNKAL